MMNGPVNVPGVGYPEFKKLRNDFDEHGHTADEVGAAAKYHGNHVPATETADNARFLRNDNTWQEVTPENIGAAETDHTHNAADVGALTEQQIKNLISEAAGGVSITKLWENASPTSTFAGQSVSVDLSDYDFYMVIARTHTSLTNDASYIARVGQNVTLSFNDNSGLFRRVATYSETKLTFSDQSCAYLYNTTAQTNNAYMIPVAIYGIRGVS